MVVRVFWLVLLCACSQDDPEDTGMDLDPGTDPEVDTEVDTDPDTDAVVCSATLQLDDGAGGCRAVQVLLLDDGTLVRGGQRSSGPEVIDALQQPVDGVLGVFDVTNAGYAPLDWDGVIPDGTDVVFWAQGVDYTTELDAPRMAALTAFLDAGGGIVRTEWAAGYQELHPELSPVTTPDRDYFEGDNVWSIATDVPDAMQSAIAHLPQTFTLNHGMTHVETVDGAVVLATLPFDDDDDPETPALAVPGLVVQPATAERGTLAYVNHDLLYVTTSMTEPEVAPLLQGITYAAAAGL